MADVVNLDEAIGRIATHWHPHIVAELNGQEVKLARLEGEFIWHHHDAEDELFLVLKGTLRMEMRDRTVTIGPGELFVVPRGVEHRPVADDEVHVMLFEPAGTINTGETPSDRRVEPTRS